jgi:hypothetical protein
LAALVGECRTLPAGTISVAAELVELHRKNSPRRNVHALSGPAHHGSTAQKGSNEMTDHQENKSSPEANKPPVEDLAPTEEQSADLRGGPIYMHGSGGGAGHSGGGGSGAG